MNPPRDPILSDRAWLTARLNQWLQSRLARLLLLGLAAGLSLPAGFSEAPEIGLDPSWQLSLQLATLHHKVFGQEFVFTYGPLGYLLIHGAVSKVAQLAYDFFILGSLWFIYGDLLPRHRLNWDALILLALATVTKMCWVTAPAAILFSILCYWLWQVHQQGNLRAMTGVIVAALVLFFGKVNYALIIVFLIPVYGIGLLTLQKQRRIHGILLLLGFPVLVWLGAMAWQVDLPSYLRSGIELVSGYNEAMFAYSDNSLFVFKLAVLLLLAMVTTGFLGRHRLAWRDQVMLLPLIGLAALLLFKNAFTRSDSSHSLSFQTALPLLLAVWSSGWCRTTSVRILLLGSLLYPLAILTAQTTAIGIDALITYTPWRYCGQLTKAPWQEDAAQLQAGLGSRFPAATLPAEIKSSIGQATVDVMPWESSVAILNGLNYHARPVPQSYSVYTPWLDHLNARFLSSTDAPAFVLYACAQAETIDGRPAAWDESLTKIALLENYAWETAFKLPLRVWPNQNLEPASVFVLKHTPHYRRLVPIATNAVSLALGESLPISNTTNFVFLTLKVDRSLLGKLSAAALSPDMLIACIEYQDGQQEYDRAVLPILQTGVLVNRRVESPQEICNWLESAIIQNPAVSSIAFKTHSPWAFQTPFKGFLVEYRLETN